MLEQNLFEIIYSYLYAYTIQAALISLSVGLFLGCVFYKKSILSKPIPRIIIAALLLWAVCLVLWSQGIAGPYRQPEKTVSSPGETASIDERLSLERAQESSESAKLITFPVFTPVALPETFASFMLTTTVDTSGSMYGPVSFAHYYSPQKKDYLSTYVLAIYQYKAPPQSIQQEDPCGGGFGTCTVVAKNASGGDIVKVDDSACIGYATDISRTRVVVRSCTSSLTQSNALQILNNLAPIDLSTYDFTKPESILPTQ